MVAWSCRRRARTWALSHDEATLASLRRWNLGLTVLHAIQAVHEDKKREAEAETGVSATAARSMAM